MNCRFCNSELTSTFIDLGSAPPSNSYVTLDGLRSIEKWYPLRVMVCTDCWLVQTEDYAGREEFFSSDYAYFSSGSSTWLQHCATFVDDVIKRLALSSNSLIIEVAANDGYLLQYVKDHKIPCLGIEPTKSTAAAAKEKGLEIIEDFFGVDLAKKIIAAKGKADLIIANNVLAHVPDIHDFAAGFYTLLKSDGVASFEFPYLIYLMEKVLFDTIYHEHYSYYSLTTVQKLFAKNGLEIFEVEEIPTHGGSLRIFAQKQGIGKRPVGESIDKIMQFEIKKGIRTENWYAGFKESVLKVKFALLNFLLDAKNKNLKVGAYGAAAKGNTLLNFAGVKQDLLEFVCDIAPSKQGKYLPGSRIPIFDPSEIKKRKPDYLLILPWNLKEEIMADHSYIREWGGKFVVATPKLEIL